MWIARNRHITCGSFDGDITCWCDSIRAWGSRFGGAGLRLCVGCRTLLSRLIGTGRQADGAHQRHSRKIDVFFGWCGHRSTPLLN